MKKHIMNSLLAVLVLAFFVPAIATAVPVLAPGSTTAPAGATVTIPLTLSDASEPLGNIDLTLSYDPRILEATEVLPGDLTSGALIDSNIGQGTVRLGIVSRQGFRGNGTVASVTFRVIGTAGSSSLRITDLSANQADTLAPLTLSVREGTFTILAGIRIDTEGPDQRVTVDLPPGAGTVVEGDSIRITRPDLTLTISTRGLTTRGSQLTGLVSGVSVASPPVSADLSFGRVTGRFEFTLPRYPEDGSFDLAFTEGADAGTQTLLQEAAGRKGLEMLSFPFTATLTTSGYGKTGPATGHFTVPNSLLSSLGGIDSVWFGHLSEYVSPELLKPTLESGPDPAGMVTLRVDSPEGLSLFVMASAKIKEIANPDATPTEPGQTGLTIFGNMIITVTTLATGNLVVGAVVIGLLVALVVGGILYVHRRRGG